eukprot:sb/3469809/
MFKDSHYCLSIKIVSARNVPGTVSGITPAANVICGVANRTENTHSVVSTNPIWNSEIDFSGVSRRDKLLFLLRDGDQILGSVQLLVKDCDTETLLTRVVYLLSPQSTDCSFSFLLSLTDKSAFSKKRLLATTKRLRASVFHKFGSDPNLAAGNQAGDIGKRHTLSSLPRFNGSYPVEGASKRYSSEFTRPTEPVFSSHRPQSVGSNRRFQAMEGDQVIGG